MVYMMFYPMTQEQGHTMSEIFSTRALLALQTAVYIAYHGQNGAPVKSSRIIARYRLNKRALEPILQALSRTQLVESKQGANGGYLVATPERTTLADIVEPFMDKPAKQSLGFSDLRPLLLPALQAAHDDALHRLRETTLAEAVRKAESLGIQRGEDTPLDFII